MAETHPPANDLGRNLLHHPDHAALQGWDKLVIGLIGGIGSGKSRVAEALAALGGMVIDADAIAREVLQRPEVREKLVAWWGGDVLDERGEVDRRAVGRVVFDAPGELARLEALVHPLVREERGRQRERFLADPACRFVVDDTPLLLEKGLEGLCDLLVFVDAPRHQRLERVRKTRGWDEAELTRREKNQWPLDTKRERADHVLVNDSDPSEISTRARELLERAAPHVLTPKD